MCDDYTHQKTENYTRLGEEKKARGAGAEEEIINGKAKVSSMNTQWDDETLSLSTGVHTFDGADLIKNMFSWLDGIIMLGIIKALIMNSAHRDIDLGRNTEKPNESLS